MLGLLQSKLQSFISTFGGPGEARPRSQTFRNRLAANLKPYSRKYGRPLSHRDALQAFQTMLHQDKAFEVRQKKNWHKQEVQVLVFIVTELQLMGQLELDSVDDEMWNRVSSFFHDRSNKDCKFKWLSFWKPPNKHVKWDPSEENLLREILQEPTITDAKQKWKHIADIFNHRSSFKSERQRSSKELKRLWLLNICSAERGAWRQEEDLKMLEHVRNYGKRWSFICQLMSENRTENSIKNRFISVLAKERSYHQADLSEAAAVDSAMLRLRMEMGLPLKQESNELSGVSSSIRAEDTLKEQADQLGEEQVAKIEHTSGLILTRQESPYFSPMGMQEIARLYWSYALIPSINY